MIDFVKLHPDLMWFINSQIVSGVGQENLTEFMVSHGYKI